MLGTCEDFHIKRFNPKLKGGAKTAYIHTDRNLIFFEGTPPYLGCTILLFGDTIEKLEKVKLCLHKMINKARDVILESLVLSKLNLSILHTDPLADMKEMFLAYQNIYLDEPKFICRMLRMRIGKDIESIKQTVRNEQKDPEEKFIKRNLNEMCMIPRKRVFIAYDKQRDKTLFEVLLEIVENFELM